ncbi:hypothetical protein DW755_09445, partial [Ruminococcus sp. AM29-10LB]
MNIIFPRFLFRFFQMCCSEKLKIVPIYDDRSCGPRTENQTESKKRMHTICAPKDDDEYVVPDYIFIHKDLVLCQDLVQVKMR